VRSYPAERSPLYGSVVALALTAVVLLISLQLRSYRGPDIFCCAW